MTSIDFVLHAGMHYNIFSSTTETGQQQIEKNIMCIKVQLYTWNFMNYHILYIEDINVI